MSAIVRMSWSYYHCDACGGPVEACEGLCPSDDHDLRTVTLMVDAYCPSVHAAPEAEVRLGTWSADLEDLPRALREDCERAIARRRRAA